MWNSQIEASYVTQYTPRISMLLPLFLALPMDLCKDKDSILDS